MTEPFEYTSAEDASWTIWKWPDASTDRKDWWEVRVPLPPAVVNVLSDDKASETSRVFSTYEQAFAFVSRSDLAEQALLDHIAELSQSFTLLQRRYAFVCGKAALLTSEVDRLNGVVSRLAVF